MSIEDFDVNRLPAQKWASYINAYTKSLKYNPVLSGEDSSNTTPMKNMDDRINYVCHHIVQNFTIRYGRNKYNDSHSLNATKTLMIFNPFGCVWLPYANVADMLTSALNKNLSADSHVEALADAIASELGTPMPSNTVPANYSGTRYQLFLNGIYDLKEDVFMEYDKDITQDTELYIKKRKKVKITDMGFTEKHVHNILFDMNPDPPVFEDELPTNHPEGTDWDFRTWLYKLNGENQDKVDWLLYVMGLCVLPCVNIGVNVLLRGDSGSGKSTVGSLISKMYTGADDGYGYLYDSSVEGLVNDQHKASTLNEDFPFRGSLTPKVNFIHLSEANGISLNDDASALYDKFADNNLDAKKLHASSLKLAPSPTLFMEGTKWVNFNTVKNGVERRTLPISLNPTPDLRFYTAEDTEKKELFESDLILTWLIRECFKKIRQFRGTERLNNITVNLMRETLPPFVKEWQDEIISGGDEITAFYDIIKDAIKIHKPISFEMLYDLYIESCERRGVSLKYRKNMRNFNEAIEAKLISKGYKLKSKGERFTETNIDNIGIDINKISEMIEVPDKLTATSYDVTGYGRFLSNDWFELEKEDNI